MKNIPDNFFAKETEEPVGETVYADDDVVNENFDNTFRYSQATDAEYKSTAFEKKFQRVIDNILDTHEDSDGEITLMPQDAAEERGGQHIDSVFDQDFEDYFAREAAHLKQGVPEDKTALKSAGSCFQPTKGLKTFSQRIGILEICMAAVEVLDLIRIDGNLYGRIRTGYHRLNSQSLEHWLFQTLPSAYTDKLYELSGEKIFKKTLASNLIPDFSLQEILRDSADIVALQNGFYDAANGQFLGAKEDIICLVEVQACYERDPDETPVFDSFLDRVSGGDASIRERILDLLALVLLIGRKAKKFYVLGLAPNSGKSTIADFIEALFPLEYISRMDAHDLERPHSSASVAKCAINISMDLTAEPLKPNAVSNIKLLTGEKRLEIEEKRKQACVVDSYCKLIFGTNSPLVLKSYDEAFYNRLEIVPFLRSIPESGQDMDLLNKFLEEKDAIVTKLLWRLPDLIKRNLKLTPCPVAERMKARWMQVGRDIVEVFLLETCDITCDPEDYIPSGELQAAFKEYAENEEVAVKASNALTRRVHSLIDDSICNKAPVQVRIPGRDDPVRVVRGLRWKQHEMPA